MRMMVVYAVLAVGLAAGTFFCGAGFAGADKTTSGLAPSGQAMPGESRLSVSEPGKTLPGRAESQSGWPGEKRDLKAIERVFSTPLEMKDASDPEMDVVFRHTDHKGTPCAVCHHKVTPAGERYTSCASAPGCHTADASRTDPFSWFQAYHNRESEHSCYACHYKRRAVFDGVKGCTTCHQALVLKKQD